MARWCTSNTQAAAFLRRTILTRGSRASPERRTASPVTATIFPIRTAVGPFTRGCTMWPAGTEISIPQPERGRLIAPPVEKLDLRVPGEIAAYGPWFTDFEASVEIEPPEDGNGDGGLIFRVNDRGYYLLLLQGGKGASDTTRGYHPVAYTVAKRFWSEPFMKPIVAWTPFGISPMEPTVKQSGPGESLHYRVREVRQESHYRSDRRNRGHQPEA